MVVMQPAEHGEGEDLARRWRLDLWRRHGNALVDALMGTGVVEVIGRRTRRTL